VGAVPAVLRHREAPDYRRRFDSFAGYDIMSHPDSGKPPTLRRTLHIPEHALLKRLRENAAIRGDGTTPEAGADPVSAASTGRRPNCPRRQVGPPVGPRR
jgi:hypothetical protein